MNSPRHSRSLFSRTVAATLIASMTWFGVVTPAQATVIGTETAMQSAGERVDSGHARLNAALSRADVVEILKSRGVDAEAARKRAAALSDAEAADLADRIDRAPAGGIEPLLAVALVFVVLVITDILGFTRIFSFTSPIK
jgi:hypothetical protein